MVAVRNDYRAGSAPLCRVHNAFGVSGFLYQPLHRRTVGTYNRNDALGCDHVAKTDIDEPHPKPPSDDILYLFTQLF